MKLKEFAFLTDGVQLMVSEFIRSCGINVYIYILRPPFSTPVSYMPRQLVPFTSYIHNEIGANEICAADNEERALVISSMNGLQVCYLLQACMPAW